MVTLERELHLQLPNEAHSLSLSLGSSIVRYSAEEELMAWRSSCV